MGIQSDAFLHPPPSMTLRPKIGLCELRALYSNHTRLFPTMRESSAIIASPEEKEKKSRHLKTSCCIAHPAAKFSDTIILFRISPPHPGSRGGKEWPCACACTKVSPRLPPSSAGLIRRNPPAPPVLWCGRGTRVSRFAAHPQDTPSHGAFGVMVRVWRKALIHPYLRCRHFAFWVVDRRQALFRVSEDFRGLVHIGTVSFIRLYPDDPRR